MFRGKETGLLTQQKWFIVTCLSHTLPVPMDYNSLLLVCLYPFFITMHSGAWLTDGIVCVCVYQCVYLCVYV